MPLTSPRFKNERELIALESGRAALKRGSTGRHVHLVQMALIDLGFAMPISTLSQHYSPGGAFGVETEAVVKAFQRSVPRPGLKPDGVVGQLTLRELDKRFPRFAHQIAAKQTTKIRSKSALPRHLKRRCGSAEPGAPKPSREQSFVRFDSAGLRYWLV